MAEPAVVDPVLVLTGVMRWTNERAIGGESLVCPVKLLWEDYVDFCERTGSPRETAQGFVEHLASLQGVTLRDGGRGRLKRVADGIGLRRQ